MFSGVPDKYRSEQAFIREIWFQPDELSARLIYADWLEEHQDARAQLLRSDVAMIESSQKPEFDEDVHETLRKARERLLRKIDPVWVSLVGLGQIELCPNTTRYIADVLDENIPEDAELKIEYRCPLRWENLPATAESPDVRMCSQCQRLVYYCYDVRAARQHALQNHCVAIDPSAKRFPGDLRHAHLDPGGFMGLLSD